MMFGLKKKINTQQKIDINKNFGNFLSFRDNRGRKGLHIDNANCGDCLANKIRE